MSHRPPNSIYITGTMQSTTPQSVLQLDNIQIIEGLKAKSSAKGGGGWVLDNHGGGSTSVSQDVWNQNSCVCEQKLTKAQCHCNQIKQKYFYVKVIVGFNYCKPSFNQFPGVNKVRPLVGQLQKQDV